MLNSAARPSSLLAFGSASEPRCVSSVSQSETLGGSLMVAVTVAAWAYDVSREAEVGTDGQYPHVAVGEQPTAGMSTSLISMAVLEQRCDSVAGGLRRPRPPIPADHSTWMDRRARAEHSGRVLEGYRR